MFTSATGTWSARYDGEKTERSLKEAGTLCGSPFSFLPSVKEALAPEEHCVRKDRKLAEKAANDEPCSRGNFMPARIVGVVLGCANEQTYSND